MTKIKSLSENPLTLRQLGSHVYLFRVHGGRPFLDFEGFRIGSKSLCENLRIHYLKRQFSNILCGLTLAAAFATLLPSARAAVVTDYGETASLETQVAALRTLFDNYTAKKNVNVVGNFETEVLLKNLFMAHDLGNNERVTSREMQALALSEKISRRQRAFVLVAMASSYFEKKSFRSTAEICSLLTNEIHSWSASPQMRKFATKCAFATLMAGLTWGEKLIAENELSHLIAHPGFAESRWSDTAAKALLDSASVLSVRNTKLLNYDAQTNEEGKLILANLFAWAGEPEKSLLLVAQVQDSLKQRVLGGNRRAIYLNALAQWTKARVYFDLGRHESAISQFEDASEDLLDLLREISVVQTYDELLPGLFARLSFDSVSAMEKAGFGIRALALLNRLRDGLNRLYQSKEVQVSQPDWLKQLMIDIESVAFQLSAANQQFVTVDAIQAAEKRFQESLAEMVKDSESLKTIGEEEATEGDSQFHTRASALLEKHRKLQAMAARYSVRTLTSVATERAVRSFVRTVEKAKTLGENKRMLSLALSSKDLESRDSVVWLGAGLELLGRVVQNFFSTIEERNSVFVQAEQSLKFSANLSSEVLAHLQRARKLEARIRSFLDEPARYRQKVFELGRKIEELQAGQLRSSPQARELISLERSEVESVEKSFALYNQAIDFEYAENYHARATDLANEVYFTCGRLAHIMLKMVSSAGLGLKVRHLNEQFTEALNDQLFNQLNLVKLLRDFVSDTAKYRASQSNEQRALEVDIQIKETEINRLIGEALVPLSELVVADRGSLVSSLQKSIASRKNQLKGSLLHAFGSGAISQQTLNEKLEALEETVKQAETLFRQASEKGNLF